MTQRYGAKCGICDELNADYEAAAREYVRTVEVLHRSAGSQCSSNLLAEIELAAENARIRFAATSIAKDLHSAVHVAEDRSWAFNARVA